MKALVSESKLVYSNLLGNTFLELSYDRAVRVSKHIVLKPPDIHYKQKRGDIIIEISKGISFGSGQHPTTRLCLRALEHAFITSSLFSRAIRMESLDIGTGSGVLAIASVLLGAKSVVGLDIDPCAREEAIENIRINNLEDSIEISATLFEEIDQHFSLITANLRPPTLKSFFEKFVRCTQKRSVLILSGFKAGEVDKLMDQFTESFFFCKWVGAEKNWRSAVLVRR